MEAAAYILGFLIWGLKLLSLKNLKPEYPFTFWMVFNAFPEREWFTDDGWRYVQLLKLLLLLIFLSWLVFVVFFFIHVRHANHGI
jgi:hypothetical protein